MKITRLSLDEKAPPDGQFYSRNGFINCTPLNNWQTFLLTQQGFTPNNRHHFQCSAIATSALILTIENWTEAYWTLSTHPNPPPRFVLEITDEHPMGVEAIAAHLRKVADLLEKGEDGDPLKTADGIDIGWWDLYPDIPFPRKTNMKNPKDQVAAALAAIEDESPAIEAFNDLDPLDRCGSDLAECAFACLARLRSILKEEPKSLEREPTPLDRNRKAMVRDLIRTIYMEERDGTYKAGDFKADLFDKESQVIGTVYGMAQLLENLCEGYEASTGPQGHETTDISNLEEIGTWRVYRT